MFVVENADADIFDVVIAYFIVSCLKKSRIDDAGFVEPAVGICPQSPERESEDKNIRAQR